MNTSQILTESILARKKRTVARKQAITRKRAIARLISQIENKQPEAQAVLSQLYPHTGQAQLIGVTGAPGTGKSSLVYELAKTYRQQNKTVAILAVDPTSPFSGGAVLGDRIRMQDLTRDPDVYIRSMASRGGFGGLAWAVDDTLKVLDAAGFEIILIETVGAGQNEVDIVKTAHTIVVVEAPGLGDDIQAIKAGILEIADIFVVNKADHPGVEKTISVLRQMLELAQPPTGKVLHHGTLMAVGSPPLAAEKITSWQVPVIKTIALKSEGIAAVVEAIAQHHQHLHRTGELAERNRARLADELQTVLQAELLRRVLEQLPPDYLSAVVAELLEKKLTAYEAAQNILKKVESRTG
ncbi:MAG: methylmalonyl Co-A mutase-associated GTPase MeaB [Anaerolineae bacterium]|nr:methylmalonyl Co-A mutase-associated GTPase MeaB [Anaerolineae bacterium]